MLSPKGHGDRVSGVKGQCRSLSDMQIARLVQFGVNIKRDVDDVGMPRGRNELQRRVVGYRTASFLIQSPQQLHHLQQWIRVQVGAKGERRRNPSLPCLDRTHCL